MRWYDVKINGRYEGKPREVNETVQARNEELALKKAVAAEFDDPDWGDIVWYFSGGKMCITVQDDEGGFKVLRTDHGSLVEIVTEVTDGARLSRLTVAPELPLDMPEKDIETAAPSIPDAYQRQALATWGSATDSPREQRLHALLGLVGEAGEVANLVKKQLYKPGAVADGAAVIDELADVAYYLAVLASLYGVTFDGLFAHLAGKLAGGHGWLNPSNSTGLEVNGE
jgi:NTP pyrophosphatase (non-canonical NTP hydrolase)